LFDYFSLEPYKDFLSSSQSEVSTSPKDHRCCFINENNNDKDDNSNSNDGDNDGHDFSGYNNSSGADDDVDVYETTAKDIEIPPAFEVGKFNRYIRFTFNLLSNDMSTTTRLYPFPFYHCRTHLTALFISHPHHDHFRPSTSPKHQCLQGS